MRHKKYWTGSAGDTGVGVRMWECRCGDKGVAQVWD